MDALNPSKAAVAPLSRLRHAVELIWYRATTELKAEASRSFIGVLWWVLEPLMYLLTFYVAFAFGFRGSGVGFVPFLLSGLVAWRWFEGGVNSGANSIVSNKRLIEQVHVSKVLLLVTEQLSATLKFFIVFCILAGLLAWLGHPPNLSWVYLPVMFAAQLLLIVGTGALAGSIVPFVPELRIVIDSCLKMMFFTSGIFFDISQRPPEVQEILYINPMARMLEGYRSILLFDEAPAFEHLWLPCVLGILFFALGALIMKRFDKVYAKVII